MSQLHALLGQLALVVALLAAAWAVGLAVARRPPGRWFVATLLGLVAGILVAALAGVLTAVTLRPPADPLHAVYGVAALAILPVAALIAVGRPRRRQSAIMALGVLLLAGLLVRLLQTGT